MRKWFASLAGVAALANVALAQADAPPPVQVKQIKVQIQVQPAVIQPGQVQADRAVAAPALIGPGGRQLAQADAVFVGRVIAIEPMDVEATQAVNGPKVNYRIAVVQVSESLFGLKKGTQQVRIGFIAQPNVAPPNAGGIQIQPAIQPVPPGGFGGRRPFPGNFQMQLTVGQDGLFSVNKHHKENFYLSPNFQNFVQRQDNPGFEAQLKTAKQLAKVMGDPVAALKAEDRLDRYAAAAVLVGKYRNASNPTGQPMKLVGIDAAESKLILQAIAGGDWKPGVFNAAIPAPFDLFNQLGISQKDGYNPINLRTQREVFTAMQKWLDENNGKFVIQKYVVDPNAKVPGVKPGVIRPDIRPVPPVRIQPGQVQPLPAPVPVPQDLPAQPAPKQDR